MLVTVDVFGPQALRLLPYDLNELWLAYVREGDVSAAVQEYPSNLKTAKHAGKPQRGYSVHLFKLQQYYRTST